MLTNNNITQENIKIFSPHKFKTLVPVNDRVTDDTHIVYLYKLKGEIRAITLAFTPREMGNKTLYNKIVRKYFKDISCLKKEMITSYIKCETKRVRVGTKKYYAIQQCNQF
jgi:hypothetical protein